MLARPACPRAKRTMRSIRTLRVIWTLAAMLAVATGCGDKASAEAEASAKKKALEDALGGVRPAVEKISAFAPHVTLPDDKDPYAFKQHQSDLRAATAAANSVRFEATTASQALQKAAAPLSAGVMDALGAVSKACMDATDADKVKGCAASIAALDQALEKANADPATGAAGVKFPRVGKDSITKDAAAATRDLVSARGPGPAEAEFRKKRGDAKATFDEVDAACAKADQEADAIAQQYENAEEPIRLVAVTRKMSMASQCKRLRAAMAAREEMAVCKKKPKSSECAQACGKVKSVIDDAIPAAALASLPKEQEEACKQIK